MCMAFSFQRSEKVNIFKRKRAEPTVSPIVDDVLLKSLLYGEEIDREKALNIPAVARCVNLISETVSMIPIKLYKEEVINGKSKTVEVTSDNRPDLLNDDTKDTLNGIQFKRAIVRDYLLDGKAYAYINKKRNSVQSLHYVEAQKVQVNKNFDPIFKDYDLIVHGQTYKPFEFIKITRASTDGINGAGIIKENQELLKIAYQTLKFEQNLVTTGGNKRGFVKSKNTLTKEAIKALKDAWHKMYSDPSENNVVILNNGLEFQEASSTSVEMQLNESKIATNNSILDILGVPQDFNYETFIKTAVMPVITAIECALNKDLLLEKEKKSFYFAFDTKEITKGDIKTRFEAYKTALDANIMQIDEIRYMEDLEPLGLNFIKLGLQDVLFNPETKEVYTPNTGQTATIKENIGGDG
nr:MAG TPA: portal protein [Caudoviricetes sp.]